MKKLKDEPRELPQLVRRYECIRAVQSEGVFRRCLEGGWIAPVVAERKYTVFRRSDLERIVERILAGEMPPLLEKEDSF